MNTGEEDMTNRPPRPSDMNDIDSLSYVDFISLLRETNRPPGGKHTVRYWIQNACINRTSRVLEIGCNTGFTSLELARASGCTVTGIDVSPAAVEVAIDELSHDTESVRSRARFLVADAQALPFEPSAYDVVVCGGAISFIRNRSAAMREMCRVLRPWGYVCLSPLCYRVPPPADMLLELRRILGFDVPLYGPEKWLEVFVESGLELYAHRVLTLHPRTEAEVARYVEVLLQKPHLMAPGLLHDAIKRRALDMYSVFNCNHRYLAAVLAILRKREIPEEIELFGVSE